MLCYHKEAFTLGLISALFVIEIVVLFENVIESIWERIRRIF